MSCSSRTGTSGQANDVVTICTDASSSHMIDGKLFKKELEPAFSHVTAAPASGGCTVKSLVNPMWRVGYGWFTTRDNVSLSELAHRTPFYSGSDLKNVCVAAALACVREEHVQSMQQQQKSGERPQESLTLRPGPCW